MTATPSNLPLLPEGLCGLAGSGTLAWQFSRDEPHVKSHMAKSRRTPHILGTGHFCRASYDWFFGHLRAWPPTPL